MLIMMMIIIILIVIVILVRGAEPRRQGGARPGSPASASEISIYDRGQQMCLQLGGKSICRFSALAKSCQKKYGTDSKPYFATLHDLLPSFTACQSAFAVFHLSKPLVVYVTCP